MTKLAESVVDKRHGNILIDGKCLKGGLVLQENWKPFVVTDDEVQAKELFAQEGMNVVCGKSQTVNVSTNWAKAALLEPKKSNDFKWFARRISEINGIIIYTFDDLFDSTDEDALKMHYDLCYEVLDIENVNIVYENGKKYLVGYRLPKGLLGFRASFEEFKKLFVGPHVDAASIKIKLKGLRTKFLEPEEFQEKEYPDWKTEVLFSQETSRDKLFADAVKPKFTGGTIELPNHEQLAILLASGSIDREVELADGRIVVLKGTELISTKDRIKFNLEGEPVAKVEQQVRNTVLYELDLTNATFSMLTNDEVA